MSPPKCNELIANIRHFFTRAIQNGQIKGEVPTHIDAEGSAFMRVSLTRGLALIVRAGTDPDTLWPAVNAALATLMQKE